MPEVKAADYTTGELTSAANICRDAVELLTPTADELMRIAGEVELVEEELHFTRTSRHLNAAALHLKISEATIRRITKNVGRTYSSIGNWILGVSGASALVSLGLGLLRLVGPGSIAPYLPGIIQYASGVWFGAFISLQIVRSRIRRQPRDS